jgi:hypothetical protein
MRYDHELGEAPECCGTALALYAEAQRLALLLETLAADHFPDQSSFTAWIARQQRINLRSGTTP